MAENLVQPLAISLPGTHLRAWLYQLLCVLMHDTLEYLMPWRAQNVCEAPCFIRHGDAEARSNNWPLSSSRVLDSDLRRHSSLGYLSATDNTVEDLSRVFSLCRGGGGLGSCDGTVRQCFPHCSSHCCWCSFRPVWQLPHTESR